MKYINIKLSAALLLVLSLSLALCSCKANQAEGTQSGISSQSALTPLPDAQETLSTVTIDGVEYLGNETELDLAGGGEKDIDTLKDYIKKLPLLKRLDTADNLLSVDEYTELCGMRQGLVILSKVSFEGLTLDLGAEEVDLSGTKISDRDSFERMLSCLAETDRKIKLVMCDCGYTNEEMQGLRDSYPSLDFAWRIYMGKWSLRTDDQAFSVMIYNYDYTRMTSEDISVLRYCTNLYALDLGHQAITDLSVIGELTELRVLILADNKISDLTPLKNLKKLQYLELFVNRIKDVSPLASCTELVDLNFGWNRSVGDISGIYSLEHIERLWLPTTAVPASKREEIRQTFSDAKIVFEDVDSVSSGWRTHKRYYSMRAMFTNNEYDPDFVL